MQPKSAIQQADENQKTGVCVAGLRKHVPPPEGKIVYNKINGNTQINVVNSPRGYNPTQLKEFGEMVEVLQEEGKLPTSGSVLISAIGKM